MDEAVPAPTDDLMARMGQPNPLLGIDDRRAAALHGLWSRMRRVTAAWREVVAGMGATYGLSSPQFAVFMALASGGRLTMGQIGERCVLPTSSLTTLVDRLVELGIAEREPHPGDRRAIQVQLTGEGQAMAGRVAIATQRNADLITAGLDAAELDRISAGLDLLLAGYERFATTATHRTSSVGHRPGERAAVR